MSNKGKKIDRPIHVILFLEYQAFPFTEIQNDRILHTEKGTLGNRRRRRKITN